MGSVKYKPASAKPCEPLTPSKPSSISRGWCLPGGAVPHGSEGKHDGRSDERSSENRDGGMSASSASWVVICCPLKVSCASASAP